MADKHLQIKNIEFKKMQSNGNDFVLFDNTEKNILEKYFSIEQIKKIANRKYGIGCDQVLILNKNNNKYSYKIYNHDGSQAMQCLNGLKCISKYIATEYNDKYATISNGINTIATKVLENKVELIIPKEICGNIPQTKEYNIYGISQKVDYISTDNFHAINCTQYGEANKIEAMIKAIRTENFFKEGENISFHSPLKNNKVKIKTLERGSGETLACCSAAVAVAISLRNQGGAKDTIQIIHEGGEDHVKFFEDGSIAVSGPATEVFTGHIRIG